MYVCEERNISKFIYQKDIPKYPQNTHKVKQGKAMQGMTNRGGTQITKYTLVYKYRLLTGLHLCEFRSAKLLL